MNGFRKAERKKAKLRLGLVGPAGSGKTYSALQVAFGLGGRVALIDTENGSGDLYAHLGDYDVCTLEAPYTVDKYLNAIDQAERAGYDVLIIDSLTHAWAGDGGLLDQQGKITDSGKGNGYTAWRTITPKHYKLIEAMLTSKCHVIATMRSKTEYALEEDERGKKVPVKIGMAPVQREGMDYEFGLVFDINVKHNASASKDRTGLFDGQIITLSKQTGEALKEWLESGIDVPEPSTEQRREVKPEPQTAQQQSQGQRKKAIWDELLARIGNQEQAVAEYKAITNGRGAKEWTEEDLKNLEHQLEVMREIDSAGIEEGLEDLAGAMGIGPDEPKEQPKAMRPFSETDKLTAEIKTLFREDLGFTEKEFLDWIGENFNNAEALNKLTKDERKKALAMGKQILADRDARELGKEVA